MSSLTRPRQIFRPDPVLGWRLSPNASISVPFRRNVHQQTDSEGWRRVVPSNPSARISLAIYGCSFVFGTGLRDEETFASLLQEQLPELRVRNKGIGGQSTVQAFLNFKMDVQAGEVSAGIFGIIADHRYRNVPHPYRMKAFLTPDWHEIGIERLPCAHFDRGGGIRIGYIPIWQPSLLGAPFDDFTADEHILDLASVGVLMAIREFAHAHSVPVLFALLDEIDPEFNRLICERFDCALDVATPHDIDHRFLPEDLHPNPASSAVYAERLLPAVNRLLSDVQRPPA